VGDTPDDINSGNQDRTAELATANTERRQEIEEKARAENLLRQLNQRVVRSQDEERRRIARELHDSIGQELCAIAMSLSALGEEVPTELLTKVQAILKQVDGCVKDVRTISHLLHPPCSMRLAYLRPWNGISENSRNGAKSQWIWPFLILHA
jgi:signal transduction histidine kinase